MFTVVSNVVAIHCVYTRYDVGNYARIKRSDVKVDPDGNVCLDTPVSLLNLSLESSLTFLSKRFLD